VNIQIADKLGAPQHVRIHNPFAAQLVDASRSLNIFYSFLSKQRNQRKHFKHVVKTSFDKIVPNDLCARLRRKSMDNERKFAIAHSLSQNKNRISSNMFLACGNVVSLTFA
jgi:hypothetical protein